MSHPLAGHLSVDDSAKTVRHYRYAVERMMRILGGWIALTPELSAKLLMGRHVWDNAQHVDAWGKRLPELRAHAQVSEPPNEAFVAYMDALEAPEHPGQTVERVVGIYRVLKPHLLASYEAHWASANAVYEPPTRRILARCAEDEGRHIAAGETVLQHLVTTPALEERARSWQAKLEALLRDSRGVTGTGLAPAVTLDAGPPVTLSDDARELIRLERSATSWPIPAALGSTLEAFGRALVGGDVAAVRRWLLPEAPLADALGARLREADLRGQRLVAFARIGHQRVTKLRLEGTRGSLTLFIRWVPVDDGWRAAAVELISADLAHPA